MAEPATYLELHPPARRQYYDPRRAAATGAVVLHITANTPDLSPPDTLAENNARFIEGRSDAGSYHSIVDSDSIVRLIPYRAEAFGEGTGGNRWALHLSWAASTAWDTYPESWVGPALANGAAEARNMAAWVKATYGITVPAKRITPAEYRAGKPGFIGHAELDPTRRSDPGTSFPWPRFLTAYGTAGTDSAAVPAATPPKWAAAIVDREYYDYLIDAELLLRNEGMYDGLLDGLPGEKFHHGLHALKNDRAGVKAALRVAEADRDAAQAELVNVVADHGAAILEVTRLRNANEALKQQLTAAQAGDNGADVVDVLAALAEVAVTLGHADVLRAVLDEEAGE